MSRRADGTEARFHAFIDEALREISGRDEDFLTLFPIALPDPKRAARKSAADLASRGWPADELERVLERGNDYVRSRYRTVEGREGTFFAEWVAAAVIDAHQAAAGAIPLQAVAGTRRPVRDVLEADYDLRSTAGGTRYFVRKKGSFPVVLIKPTR